MKITSVFFALFVFASLFASQASAAAVPSPRTLGVLTAEDMSFHNLETIRIYLVSLLQAFKQVPGERHDPQYRQRIARVEAMVTQASAAELLRFEAAMRPEYTRWIETMNDPKSAGTRNVTTNAGCDADSFDGALCELRKILDAITAVSAQLVNEINWTLSDIKGIFGSIVGHLPNMNMIADALRLDNARLNQAAQLANTYARLPCPAAGMQLPGFGRVGEIRTWTNFYGTIGFSGNTIQDVAPADILTSVNAQAAPIVANFPVQWLSRCLENAWNDAHDEAESAHHDMVKDRLDVVASTRASQVSVDATQAATNNVITDVAKVEAKLDHHGPALDSIESTTQRILTDGDRLETTSVRLDATATRIESKVGKLQIQQGQTSDLLYALEKDQLRMLIEADLVRQSNTRIALFQLPASVGGYLETVRAIVDETLQRKRAAGVDVRTARAQFDLGVKEYGFGNFKGAYSYFRGAYAKAVN